MFDLNVQYDSASLEATLTAEMLSFEAQVETQTIARQELFNALYGELEKVVGSVVGGPFKLYPYGSFPSGLCLTWSDIDLLLETFSGHGLETLEQLEGAFAKSPAFVDVKFIKNTSIPVLKLTANGDFNSLRIDMTLQDARHSGMAGVQLVRQYLLTYPHLKPMALVLKHLLYLGKLNDPYQKGLSSYGLVLMIVAFFQWCFVSGTYETVCSSAGRALIQFLRHYGSAFDYTNWRIAPSAGAEIANPYIPVR